VQHTQLNEKNATFGITDVNFIKYKFTGSAFK